MDLAAFPQRLICALTIAIGGLMHWFGLYMFHKSGADVPWWVVAGFVFFGTAYPLSALAILKRVRAGLWAALLGPAVGSLLIFLGIVLPATGLMVFIPGTLGRELTLIGFITLVVEPIALVLAAELLIESPSR